MASKPKHPPGPAITLGNMRELGVQRLIASCLNDACRHVALIDVWSYPAETEIPAPQRRGYSVAGCRRQHTAGQRVRLSRRLRREITNACISASPNFGTARRP